MPSPTENPTQQPAGNPWPRHQLGTTFGCLAVFLVGFMSVLDPESTAHSILSVVFILAILAAGPLLIAGRKQNKARLAAGKPAPHSQRLRWTNLILVGMGFLFFLAPTTMVAFTAAREAAARNQKATAKSKTITTGDGRGQIDMPAGWTQNPQGAVPNHSVVTADLANDLWVSTIRTSKLDIKQMDLHGFLTLAMAPKSSGPPMRELSPPTTQKVGGHPALQAMVSTEVEGVNVTFLVTVIETPQDFWQVQAWATKSRYQEHESTLKSIVESFRTIDP